MHTLEEQVHAINERADALKPGERFQITGLPAEIYHATTGIGSSALRAACQSMAHYWSYLHTERHESKDMLLGTMTHLFVFEPERVNALVVVQPEHLTPGNNNAWKAWKESQTRTIITRAEWQYASAMADSVFTSMGDFFTGGYPELSVWMKDEQTGLILKARADYVLGDALIDLKTTRATRASQFSHICKKEYAIQDALYIKVTGLADMVFAGVSKEAPYQCFLVKQGKDVRVNAANKIAAALDAIVFAKEYGSYPLPPIEVLETSLSLWD